MLTPGSPEALRKGCTCPSEQNQDGQGTFNVVRADPSTTHYLVEEGCPLHGNNNWREE